MNRITRRATLETAALALAGVTVGGVVLGEHADPALSRPSAKQDTEILKVLLGQIRDDREINAVVNKALAVLVKADRSEPFSNAGHGGPPPPLFHTYTTEEPRGGT